MFKNFEDIAPEIGRWTSSAQMVSKYTKKRQMEGLLESPQSGQSINLN